MSLSLSRPCSSFLPRRFYRFCFPRCTLLLPFLTPFLRVSVLPFQSVFLFIYFPWSISFLPAYPSRDVSLSFSSSPSLSLYFSARMRRVSKAHRHHAISFAAGPPRIQVAAGPEMSTERRKRLQTGTGGNDSVAKAMAMAMTMAMAMARTAIPPYTGDDCGRRCLHVAYRRL